ncbi:hypothetical protein L2D14_12490 [Thalassospiraceae bacterium LMO-JJ14]|nr:hypothetical protein L2D14_12490 [Thalassospiraceae bacterium LMO-JJ14]
MSALHQLTMSYMPEEDRILFRLATKDKKEYRLFLTRRFIHVLWGALKQSFEKDQELAKFVDKDVQEAVLGMKHQEAVQSTDFDTPAAEDTVDTTSNSGPLLVIGGKIHPGEKITGVTFKTADGADIRFNLNEQLMHAFCHLIVTTSLKADWKLDLALGKSNVVVPKGDAVVH